MAIIEARGLTKESRTFKRREGIRGAVLDLMAKEGIRRFFLKENRTRGATMLLTTHDLSDIEELCERVIVIDRGKLLFDGPLASLKATMGGSQSLVFQVAPARGGQGAAGAGIESLREISAGRPYSAASFRASFPASLPAAFARRRRTSL